MRHAYLKFIWFLTILVRLGPCFTNVCSMANENFDENFISASPQLWNSGHYEILHMAGQLCTRGMCKNLLRSDGGQRNYGKLKFPLNLICRPKIFSEMGPRWHHSHNQLNITKSIGLRRVFCPHSLISCSMYLTWKMKQLVINCIKSIKTDRYLSRYIHYAIKMQSLKSYMN